MQSITDLQNTLTELQSMINGTIQPVLNDLQNTSHIFDPVISSHTLMLQKIDEMAIFLNSAIVKGDIGLTGDDGYTPIKGVDYFDGLNGIDGLNGVDGQSFVLSQLILTVPSNVANSTTTLAQIASLLSSDFVANAVYEISVYIQFVSVASTTGLSLALAVPSNAVFYGETIVSITSNPSNTSNPFRLASPNSSKSMISTTSSGVLAVGSVHNALIKGVIKTNALGASLLCCPLFASEVAGSAVTIQAGSFLILKRIA